MGFDHVLSPPQACLVNLYRDSAKMGLHVDAAEKVCNAPVVSVSLGDTAIFRLGNATRGGKTASFRPRFVGQLHIDRG
jgi:DNA oxidative demethylase